MEIVVFQQNGSGERKIEGVKRYGHDITITQVFNIDESLPDFIDTPADYIDLGGLHADLVLNFFKHPDLSEYLMGYCADRGITIVSSGKQGEGFTPFTCCGLGKSKILGEYGHQFGFPEYRVTMDNDTIASIEVVRGAPCGATWTATKDLVGLPLEKALSKVSLQVQYCCVADPSAFDPVSGKSSVHYAGYAHIAALEKAAKQREAT